jgi:hypothetical protein
VQLDAHGSLVSGDRISAFPSVQQAAIDICLSFHQMCDNCRNPAWVECRAVVRFGVMGSEVKRCIRPADI